MAPTVLFVLPDYSGVTWEALPNLKRGAQELGALLEDHAAEVRSPAISDVAELARMLAEKGRGGGEPLLVYVGGHGLVHQRRHYTALDATPPRSPGSHNALWSGILGELLTGGERDVLLVLDTCFAGEGAGGIASEATAALADMPCERAFGVIASCRAFEPAQDGLFVERLLELVRAGPRHDLSAWGPGDERIQTGALVSELERSGLRITGSANWMAGVLRLIPNPGWNAGEPEGRVNVKAALRRLTRDGGAHLIEKSAGFVGRANVRREIAEWLAAKPRGTFVVTGGPGTGKSALMGLLARQSVGDPAAAAVEGASSLAPGTFDVIVHARQKTLEAVRDELSAVASADGRVTVLVDALDEAVAGEAPGIAAHLFALARRNAAAIVVGTRPGPAVAGAATMDDALLRELDPQRLHRLDNPKDDTTGADIAAMVRGELLHAAQSPYRAAGVPIDEIAGLVAAIAKPSFLFAQATARWLCSRDRAISEEPGWRERLERSTGEAGLGQLVEEDLAARFPSDLERVRDLLRAAAWSEGLGLPRYTIWTAFANELSKAGASYSDPDVTWLLNEAGWYLTESSEDGQSVYRLFHQALTDHFRADTPGPAEEVQARLAALLHTITGTAGGWQRADPYILHYLIAHAEQATAASDTPSGAPALLAEPAFVAHADADRLARAVRRLRGRIPGPVGPLLERTVHLLSGLPPPQRLALLELTALQEQLADPSTPPAPGAPWWPIWAHWRPSTPHVTLTGHDNVVESVAFSPDGATLASASDDATIRLWDTATGEHKQTLTGHDNVVESVAFSPDGATLASASRDATIRLWNTATGEHKQTLTGHDNVVESVAFSPDGATLASAGWDHTLRLWDTATGEHKQTLTGHDNVVESVAFSPDGATLASASDDATIRLWDTATGEHKQTLTGHDSVVASVAFSPAGATLASGSWDATIRLWDTATGEHKQTLTGHDNWVESVAFSPDGATLASASDDATIRLWDTATGEHKQTLTGHDSVVASVAFSPDGATLASASWDHTIRLWDTATGEHKQTLTGHDNVVASVAFSPDGATLASASWDHTIRLWDTATGEHKQTLTGHDNWVESVAFPPDGATLASASWDHTIRLWDTATGEHKQTLTGHDNWVESVAFSPDGATLASASNDATIRLWDTATGEHKQTLTGHDNAVESVAFSPDGATLASGSWDHTIRLWDTATGEHKQTLTGHDNAVESVAFSPDGATLASGSWDATIRLWDTATGEHKQTLTGHDNWVESVAFSPDGATLASASDDATIRLWDTATAEHIGLLPAGSVCRGVAWSCHTMLAIAASAGVAAIDVR